MQARLNSSRRLVDLLVISAAVVAALVCPRLGRDGPGECVILRASRVANAGIPAAMQPAEQMCRTAGAPDRVAHVSQPSAPVPIDVMLSSLLDELDAAPQATLPVNAPQATLPVNVSLAPR
jgi:hypothetical protein